MGRKTYLHTETYNLKLMPLFSLSPVKKQPSNVVNVLKRIRKPDFRKYKTTTQISFAAPLFFYIDSTISLPSKSKISSHLLIFSGCTARFVSAWSVTPKTGFLRMMLISSHRLYKNSHTRTFLRDIRTDQTRS